MYCSHTLQEWSQLASLRTSRVGKPATSAKDADLGASACPCVGLAPRLIGGGGREKTNRGGGGWQRGLGRRRPTLDSRSAVLLLLLAQVGIRVDMSAAAARCFRAIPTARCMLNLSRNRTPTAVVAGLLPRADCGQAILEELAAKFVRQTGVVGADAVVRSSAGNGRLSAVLPTLEAVNRNARRPKKVRATAQAF